MNDLQAQLSREDYVAYCKASAEPLTEECKQILMQARTEQWGQILLWGGALLAVVLAVLFLRMIRRKILTRNDHKD